LTDTILLLILEGAVILTCGLVLYCLYIINGLKTANKILDVSIEDNDKEIQYLQDAAKLGKKSGNCLATIEESFAKYRGQTKIMMQKMKQQELEINQLEAKIEKADAQSSAMLNHFQAVMKQSPELAKSIKTPLVEASIQNTQDKKIVTDLKNQKVRLEARTKGLEQRLKQTLVEKDFIEQRFVEFAEAEEITQTDVIAKPISYQGRSNTTVQ
jgi:hypothetical protein